MLTRKLRTTLRGGALLAGAVAVAACGTSALIVADAASGVVRQVPVLVCQATGDGSYVLVRVLPDRLQEYRTNPNNLVPAPAGGCPASVGAGTESIPAATTPSAAPPATTPVLTPPSATPATASSTTTPAPKEAATPKRATPTAVKKSATPAASTVAGTQASSTTTAPTLTPAPAPAPAPVAYTGALPANLDRLANTGSDSALLMLLGADLVLLGAGLRLRARAPR